MINWDKTTDLLIIGSGAGGMSAALQGHDQGLDVLIIEKAETFGGTSAMSGGSIWVPMNNLMQEAHIEDSLEQAWEYLKNCVGPTLEEKRARAYVEKAPEIIAYLATHTHFHTKIIKGFCDYYPTQPGAHVGGRTLEALPFLAKNLKDKQERLHPAHPQELIFKSLAFSSEEGLKLLKGGWPAFSLFIKTFCKWWAHQDNSNKNPFRLCLGNALVSRFYCSLMDRNIPVWYDAQLEELIYEDKKVLGAIIKSKNNKLFIQAKRGVVLAAGGFAKNAAMREHYLPSPTHTDWSAVQANDQGDAIRLGQQIGAATHLMGEAWWMPVTLVPGETLPWVIVYEKALPGSLMVNQAGKRFTNEASPYINVVKDMYRCHATGVNTVPCFLIMDAECRRKYPLGKLFPGQIQPFFMIKNEYKNKWLTRANTLAELAGALEIPAENLLATVHDFNNFAAVGRDPEFHRGESPYDNSYISIGDPATCLAPLKQAPFYAIPVYPGDIGTKGGLKTDEFARVLNKEDEIIPNLYAIGNSSASMMGHSYPGAGATLGPAIVFGYLAAQNAAQKILSG